jgi:hypothetical protein
VAIVRIAEDGALRQWLSSIVLIEFRSGDANAFAA